MFAFEIEIAKREQLNLRFKYPYKVVPLSERAKLIAYRYLKTGSGFDMNTTNKMIAEVLTEENLARYPFTGKMAFFYNDTKETDSVRVQIVKDLAIWGLSRSRVEGFDHRDSFVISKVAPLVEGIDYRIEIGDKVTYPEPAELNYDGIKAL
jgi:hypothetical protein